MSALPLEPTSENVTAQVTVPERAHALLGKGRCLLRLGSEDARQPLLEARTLFAGLGAEPLVAQTDALVHHAGSLG